MITEIEEKTNQEKTRQEAENTNEDAGARRNQKVESVQTQAVNDTTVKRVEIEMDNSVTKLVEAEGLAVVIEFSSPKRTEDNQKKFAQTSVQKAQSLINKKDSQLEMTPFKEDFQENWELGAQDETEDANNIHELEPTHDPCQGLSFLQQQNLFDKLKETISPIDLERKQQILRNPKKPGEFITVQLIFGNVFSQVSQLSNQKTPSPFKLCKGPSSNPHKKDMYFRWYLDTDANKDKSADEKIKIRENLPDVICHQCQNKTQEHYTCKDSTCDKSICPLCYAQDYMRAQIIAKTSRHSTFSDYNLVRETKSKDDYTAQKFDKPQQARPESKEFIVIGFWDKQNKCYAQYFVNNPVVYNLTGLKNSKQEAKILGKKFQDNSLFIFEGELGELFYFHRKFDGTNEKDKQRLYLSLIPGFGPDQKYVDFKTDSEIQPLPVEQSFLIDHNDQNDNMKTGRKICYQLFGAGKKEGSGPQIGLFTLQQVCEPDLAQQRLIIRCNEQKETKGYEDIYVRNSMALYHTTNPKFHYIQSQASLYLKRQNLDQNSDQTKYAYFLHPLRGVTMFLWEGYEKEPDDDWQCVAEHIIQTESLFEQTDESQTKKFKHHPTYDAKVHTLAIVKESEYQQVNKSNVLKGFLMGDKLYVITEDKLYYFQLQPKFYHTKQIDYGKNDEIINQTCLVAKTIVSETSENRITPLVKNNKVYITRGLEIPKHTDNAPNNYQKYLINIIDLSELEKVESAKNFKFKDQTFKQYVCLPQITTIQNYKLIEQEVEIQEFDPTTNTASFLLTVPKSRFTGSIKTWFQTKGTSGSSAKSAISAKGRVAEKDVNEKIELKDGMIIHTSQKQKSENSTFDQFTIQAEEICSNDHHIEYPILMQCAYHPKRNKIQLSNLTTNQHKVMLDLGKWSFIKWVESPAIQQFKSEIVDEEFGFNDIFCLVQHPEKNQQHLMRINLNSLMKMTVIDHQDVQGMEAIMGLRKLPKIKLQDSEELQKLDVQKQKGSKMDWLRDYDNKDQAIIKAKIEEDVFIILSKLGTQQSAIKKAVLLQIDPRHKFQFLVVQCIDNIYSFKYDGSLTHSTIDFIKDDYFEQNMDPTFICYFSNSEIFYVSNKSTDKTAEVRSISYDIGEQTLINRFVKKFTGDIIQMASSSEQTERLLLVLTSEKILYMVNISDGQVNDQLQFSTRKIKLDVKVVLQAQDAWAFTILGERCIQLKTTIHNLMFFNFNDLVLQDQNNEQNELFPFIVDNVDDVNWTEKQQSLKRNIITNFSFIHVKQNIASRQISLFQSKVADQIHECLTDQSLPNKNLEIYDDKAVARTINESGETIYTVFNYKTSMLIGVFKSKLRFQLITSGNNNDSRVIEVQKWRSKADPKPLTTLYKIFGVRDTVAWEPTHQHYFEVKENVETCLNKIFKPYNLKVETEMKRPLISNEGVPTFLWALTPILKKKQKKAHSGDKEFAIDQAETNPDVLINLIVNTFKNQFFKIVTKREELKSEKDGSNETNIKGLQAQFGGSSSNTVQNAHKEIVDEDVLERLNDPDIVQTAYNDICVSYLFIKDGVDFTSNPESVVLTKNCIAWKIKSKFHFVRIRESNKTEEMPSIFQKIKNYVLKRDKKALRELEAKGEEAFAHLKIEEQIHNSKTRIRREDIDVDAFTAAYVKMSKLKVKKYTEESDQIFTKDFSKNMLPKERQHFKLIVPNKKQAKLANLAEKRMEDVIQIRRNEVSTIWNLDEGDIEEVNYITNQRLKDLSIYVPNCHQQEVNDGNLDTGYGEIGFNKNMTLVTSILKDGLLKSQKAVLVRFYCELDLQMMMKYHREAEATKVTDPVMLLSVVNNQTFFTLLREVKYSSIMDAVSRQIKDTYFEKQNVLENPIDNYVDHPIINGLFNVLNMRLKINLPKVKSDVAQFFNLALDKNFSTEFKSSASKVIRDDFNGNDQGLEEFMKKELNIPNYALQKDPRYLDQLLTILIKSRQIRMSTVINNNDDMSKILTLKSKNSQELLKKACIETSSTEKIQSLMATEAISTAVYFNDSAVLDESEIQPQLKQSITKQLGSQSNLEFLQFKTRIIEVHWIQGDIKTFYQNLQLAGDDENFDNEVINILLDQIDFQPHLLYTVFLPWLLYVGAITYYSIFVVTEPEIHDKGFVGGEPFHIFLRIFITIMSGYNVFIQFVQIISLKLNYFYNFDSYMQFLSIFVAQWVISEHSTHFCQVDQIRIAQVASLLAIVNWIQVALWMRLFKKTSYFLKLIQQTMIDIKEMLLMIAIIIATFATGNVILERQMVNLSQMWADLATTTDPKTGEIIPGENQYQHLLKNVFGNYVTDSWLTFYFNLFGNNTDAIPSNPSSGLLWIYLIIQIFFCNIIFLNMLIGIMGGTLGDVFEHKERNSLKMTTDLYTDFIGWLNLVGPEVTKAFQQQRYMYVAKRIEVDLEQENKVEKEQIDELAKGLTIIKADVIQSLENEASIIAEQQALIL